MTRLTRTELTELIIRWVREHRLPSDFSDPEITEDTDLMAVGLLDSLGFVDLLLFIESQSGINVDLTDVEPSEFTVVKGLCNITLSGPNGHHEQPIDVALSTDSQQVPDYDS